jgi:hypothetical protein
VLAVKDMLCAGACVASKRVRAAKMAASLAECLLCVFMRIMSEVNLEKAKFEVSCHQRFPKNGNGGESLN